MVNNIIKKIKERRLLVVLLLLFFVVNAIILYKTFSEKTTSSIWNGKIATKFSSGDGSALNPYIIDDGMELAYFFTLINGDESSNYFNKFYEIRNNIDLNGYDFSFAKFDKTFSGVLNGNGYTISNFVISNYYLNDIGDEINYSLFDSMFNANIKNINFENITFNIGKFENEENTKIEESKEEIKSSDEEPVALLVAENTNEEKEILEDTNVTSEGKEEFTEIKERDIEESSNTSQHIEDTLDNKLEENNISESNDIEEIPKAKNEDIEETSDDDQTIDESNDAEETIETEEEVKPLKINISLFKNVKQSKINNISLNNIKVNIEENDLEKYSSLFILNDKGENEIENISISNGLSQINSSLLILNYNNSIIKNIAYTSNGLPLINDYDNKNNDSIFEYYIKDGKINFKNEYSVSSILKLFNENSTLNWKVRNNNFKLINNGKDENKKPTLRKSRRSAPDAHDSGTENNNVYINDYDADYNYYEGINYTYSSNGRIPNTDKKNIYSDSNLVYVQVTYSGTNIEGTKTGRVSNTENHNKFIYYKVYPVNNNETASNDQDDYIEIELIDNPYARRPDGLVFQGWLTDYEDAIVSLDTDIYVRKAKVPVTYTSNTPDNISINFYAVWGNGKITNYGSSWSNTFGNLDSAGFHAISSVTYTYDVTGLYIYTYVSNGRNYPSGAVNSSGQSLSGRCNGSGYPSRCYYYIITTSGYSSSTTYYSLVNGRMTQTQPTQVTNYSTEVPVGNSIAGYYRQTRVPNGSSLVGYFNSSGESLSSGTCNTSGGCTNYYELIQYYDENGNEEVVTSGDIYYYKTTRDTNVVVLASSVSGVWSSSQNKPFTFTGINNGTTYNTYWGLYSSGGWFGGDTYTPYCYADTRIEQMHVYTGVDIQNNNTAPSGNRGIYGNTYNLKLGRGLTSSTGSGGNTTTSSVTFRFAIGAKMSTTGSNSSTGFVNYTLIVESGIYNNLGLTSLSGSDYNYYVHAKGIFGNDFDRVTENNPASSSKLVVRYCLSGSWAGNIYGNNITDTALFTNVKSGQFGINKYDYAAGVYVGGRGSGNHYATRTAVIEGGYIYNLIGGPLTREANKQYNDTYIYVKGGNTDIIIGGAGRTGTYGNKIIQVTGGKVNYAVFGGSNGIEGNDSDQKGTIDGDSFVYIGGNSVIGDATLVSNNTVEPQSQVEAGSVFGIGNGNSSYSFIGTVNNSNVIIDGNATINRNVYGGGNYGATGQNGTNQTYNTKIIIHGGEIKGSVYGGGNNNGAGSTSNTCNINIIMDSGTVNGSVYGGSRTKGTIYGSTNVNILSGRILTDVYGGGEGGYLPSNDNSTPGTFVANNVEINIGTSTAGPTINGSVYGGSAYGTVNATAINPTANNKTVTVNVNNGTVLTSVFGGAKGSSTYTPYIPGYITVNINGGTVTNAFGGFDEAGKPGHDPVVNITGGTTTNVYGGGNKTSVDNTQVNMQGGSVTTIYGGSNQLGDVLTTDVNISGGAVGTVFGGNNQGGTCAETSVEVTGGTINSAIYGGGNLVNTGDTVVDIYNASGTIPNIYGGGNQAGADTTEVNLHKRNGSNNIVVTNVYGGSNQSGAVTTSNVNIDKGTITNAFGGGNSVGVETTNVTVSNENTINVTTIYGGSNQQGNVDESNVIINGGNVGTVYGANNAGGVTTDANVTLNNGTVSTIYGGGNEAEGTVTHVTINSGNVTTVFGGGNQAKVNTSTNITVNNASSTITSIYGGGNQAGATETNVTIMPLNNNLNITNVFGGSNQSGNVDESNVTIEHGTITNLYGGNNAGGKTSVANTTVNNGIITNAYGGGNQANTDSTNIVVNDGTINVLYGGGNAANVNNNSKLELLGGTITTNVYGGGNEGIVTGNTDVLIEDATVSGNAFAGGNGSSATVNGNTSMKILDSDITSNIYGGGNNGTVLGNTNVIVNDSNIGGSAYAGGNGSSATVYGNTNIIVGGNTVVGSSTCTVLSTCSVFGGGNAATTGTPAIDNSNASVKIAGATIYGNVYGGANTSKVHGATDVNIGDDVTLVTDITAGDIVINGTVFGGGEANASGSDEYDWTFVSVTQGINVNINGANRSEFKILGSIFGSGNASTAAGTSIVTIKNYGTYSNPQRNTSIQRTDLLTIDNSAIILIGATDRENEYSDVLFTLSRIGELNLKNNSTLFLETGANLLQKFKSITSTGALAAVNIDTENETITKNVDNRVYMFIDKKLNIAKNQNITDYGEVSGMSFFGMYKYNSNGTINTGIYDKHQFNDVLDWGGVFDNVSSYVLGLHKTAHNIKVDGFYTNYIDEETSRNKINYIEPTPPTGDLYMWTIGEGVIEYEIDLSASKYSTLGTTELSLMDFTDPNTSFQILGFDYSELESGIQLIEKTNIKKIADTSAQADTIMGLSMETSNTGWLTNGYTSFLTNENNSVIGTREYVGGNSTVTPTVLFYLHHSKNIATAGDLGRVRIQLMSVRQIDALTKETKRLIITVNLSRTLFNTVNYEGSMTAGRKYDLFTSTTTNITSSSSISAYYSLFNAGTSIYRAGYHRALVSNYVLPLNTKITMIDLSKDNPEYYYHIINATDVANATSDINLNGTAAYNLSMFEVMGALNSGVYYNDATKNSEYCVGDDYCNEDFIFIIDFGDTNISSDALNNQLLIEIRNNTEDTIYSVLAPQHLDLMYNIYTNKDALIDMNGTIDKNKIYSGETLTTDMVINYTQSTIGSTTIYDTHYFDSKLGIKITLLNSDDEVVSGATLLGLYYEIDGVNYFPNIDGTTRIKLADKVDSAEKWILVHTGTSKIATGNYKLRFDSFGSPDGIYYGLNSSDTQIFNIEIVNEIYGLDITTTAEEMIIDAESGLNASGGNRIIYNVRYNSGLTNPKIHLKMYRRNYNEVYDTTYTLVDAQDYFDNSFVNGFATNEYLIMASPVDNSVFTLELKDELLTGTYKLEFILYDDHSAIGTVDKYIIIK